MNARQQRQIEALTRVQVFVKDHPLPPPGYGAPEAMVDEVVAALDAFAERQALGRREAGAATRRKRALQRDLRLLHLKPIAQFARALAREKPGLERALVLPRDRIATTRLLTEAAAVRATAATYEPLLVARGFRDGFLTRLDVAIDAIGACMLVRSDSIGAHVGARKGLDDYIRRGRDAIEMLDALIRPHFAGDAAVLARWRTARRVVRVPQGRREAAPAPADETVGPPIT